MSNRDDSLSVWRMYDFCASYMGLHAAFLRLKRCDLKVEMRRFRNGSGAYRRMLETRVGRGFPTMCSAI